MRSEVRGVRSEDVLLLVEDNQIDEMLTLRAFAESGVANETKVVRDGAEAIEFLQGTGRYAGRDSSKLPCLVFLDLKVPKVNGLEVLKSIRHNDRTRLLPVVVLTSSVEQRDLIESYSLGANSYIRKQVDFESFLKTVKQMCDYWLKLNQGPPNIHGFVSSPP